MEGRALSPDMVCRDSEEPGCSGGVLPDPAPTEASGVSTGQSPGTLAPPRWRITVQGAYGVRFCSQVQALIEESTQCRAEPCRAAASAGGTSYYITWPEIYPGIVFLLTAVARSGCINRLRICHGSRSTCLPCLPAGRRQAGKQKP